MPTKDAPISTDTVWPEFKYLPAYAQFLLQHKLTEFSALSLSISRELQLPLLRYFETMPEEQLISLGIEGNRRLLTALSEDRVAEYIEEGLRIWKENELPLIHGDDIVIEDISKGNFTRRKVFRDFLPLYTSDISAFTKIMEEADRFTQLNEESSYKMLFEMKEAKIREHHHFIDKITNASPGIIYVYETKTLRRIYSNQKREQVLGYTDEDIEKLGENARDKLVHPDDLQTLKQHQENMLTAADKELRTVEYRVLSKQGKYVWQRAYETVFKRSGHGIPQEIIGIAIDVSQEKIASIQLEQREQQLREAQEIAEMGSFDWDLQGKESVFSPYLFRIFEMDGRSNLTDFLRYVHPADRNSVKQAIADALSGKSDYECEYRYRKNGPEKVIWSRGKVVFENGKAVKMKGTVMDVTLRHDMVKRLARSEQLNKQAQALTHLGNWSWSLSDDKVEWSDEMYRIFGLVPQSESMTFDRFQNFIHPSDREFIRQALNTAISTKHADDYLMRVVTEDGSIRYIEGKSEVLVDEEGVPYKLVGTCQDITEHYLLNERLKENEEASRQLINNAPEAVVVVDQKSNILLWNPKAEEIFGWSREEAEGKTLMDTIIPASLRQRHVDAIHGLRPDEHSNMLNRNIEIEALRKGGELFYVALNISRSLRGGKLVYIAFIRDISEERAIALKLEEQRSQLALQNRELERSNQELMAFNYISSHDLKEPVRKIKIFSNLITANTEEPLSPNQRDSIGRITAAADHMERLIEALVVFSRTSTGERQYEEVDLTDVVAEIEFLMKDSIEEQRAVINIGALPVISAVPFQIQQLFENIIGNALKYAKTNAPPHIRVSARQVKGSAINEPGAEPDALYHHISVSDNGIGFDQQYATRIFEVFQRLHSKESYSGTGIGLAICKKIVQNHNGFINAQSIPGVGTTFNIYLPASEG